MPITGALLMDKPKLLELVDQMRLGIPQEVKAAEEMLSQKDQIMNNALADARRARSKSEDEFREKLTQSEFQAAGRPAGGRGRNRKRRASCNRPTRKPNPAARRPTPTPCAPCAPWSRK